MIHSMTAYAGVEAVHDGINVAVEIRSYNSRFLDIALKVPHEYAAIEEKIKARITGSLSRGRIDVRIRIEADMEPEAAFRVVDGRACALDAALNDLAERFGWDIPVPADFLLGSSGVVKPVQAAVDAETHWPAIDAGLEMALKDLLAMRGVEGAHIAEDLSSRIRFLDDQLSVIRAGTQGLLPAYQQRLQERIAALTRGLVEIDPARIAQEAAFLADKSDISEEIVRAESHLKQFRELMDGREPAGRQLNFLLQELNREFNTMGSKAGDANLAHLIVSVKSEIEKIREQVQNIE